MNVRGLMFVKGILAVCLLAGCGAVLDPPTGGEPVAGATPSLRIEGFPTPPEEIPLTSLMARPSEEFEWGHEGKSNRYRGIPLVSLLEERGLESGKGGDAVPKRTKHTGLKSVLVATATDGYQVVFSYAELSASVGSTKAWLVWEMDGKPLPESMAPLRIVVPTDSGADRCLYQVRRLTVVDMRNVVAPEGADR